MMIKANGMRYVAVFCFVLAASPAPAGTTDRLEGRIQDLERKAADGYRILGIPLPSKQTRQKPIVIAQRRAVAEMSLRVDQVEAQMRNLTGQIQELSFQIRQLQDQIRRMQEDTEFRLQEIEGGGNNRGKRSQVVPQTNDTVVTENNQLAPAGQPKVLGQIPASESSEPLDAPRTAPGAPLDLTALLKQPGILDGNAGGGQNQQTAALSSGNPQDQYDVAYGHILRGDYVSAERGFSSFLDAHPDNQLAPNAHYWMGEAQYSQGRYADAADAFLTVYKDYSGSAKSTEALLKLGMSLDKLGHADKACATYAKLLTDFPDTSPAIRQSATRAQKSAGC